MIFASDLDNTLIHSRKAAASGDICVESVEGRQLSFMSPQVRARLRELSAVCEFIPVTARTQEQYARLDLGVTPRYALVACGAMLLVDGENDAEWLERTGKILPKPLPDVQAAEYVFDVRTAGNYFIFAKSANSGQAAAHLADLVDVTLFDICGARNKVYIIRKPLSKGYSLKRLLERLEHKYLVCAGDSRLDFSMLRMADQAFVPEEYPCALPQFTVLPGSNFTENLLDAVLELCAARRKAI
jgi:hydroxymethylpyrimidine pyrophosphatase-like HAD family hydrolase